MSESSQPCPCESGALYEACCGPLHEGVREAATPEQLMRSRYCAFVKGKAGYLWHTLHPDHDDKAGDPRAYVEHLRRGSKNLVYKRLEVLGSSPEDAEGVAQVLFRATVLDRGRDVSFTELSSFVHDGTGWRYLFGVPKQDSR